MAVVSVVVDIDFSNGGVSAEVQRPLCLAECDICSKPVNAENRWLSELRFDRVMCPAHFRRTVADMNMRRR